MLKTLIEEVHLCGGKLISISTDLYYQICKGETEDFEPKIFRKLSELREAMFFSQIERGSQNVHCKNKLMQKIGEECGIPGGKEAKEYNDEYAGSIDIAGAKKGFFRRYNSFAIANFVMEQFRDKELKNLYLDWVVNELKFPSKLNDAWLELIQEKGKLSEDREKEEMQKKILLALQSFNGEIDWEQNLEEDKASVFKFIYNDEQIALNDLRDVLVEFNVFN